MNNPRQSIEAFIEWTGRATAWLILAMVLTTFLIVVMRYGFDQSSIALQEAVTWLFALSFLLGAAYTLQGDAHVRVDIFYRDMHPRHKALVDVLGILLLLLPTCLFIFIVSWPYVITSWELLEGSREPGGLPGVFLLKTAILLSMALVIVQALVQLVDGIAQLRRSPAE